MFETLQNGLQSAFKSLRGKGKLTAANMKSGLKLVEQSLVDADVQYDVVQDFIQEVSESALGEKVLLSLNPDEQLFGIVHRKLVEFLGPVDDPWRLKNGTNILMLCGLQGSGKTTTCGKLASLLKREGRKSLLVAADLQRPAAIDQLNVIGETLGVPVYSDRTCQDPVVVCNTAIANAKKEDVDIVILDTAGRLAIDQELMNQLQTIDRTVQPDQAFLVVDGMTGQDAVQSASRFNQALELDGVIMTKLDGDARGGALLSTKRVTGVPIRFIGNGESLDDLEYFRPEGMAGRILGQGDLVQAFEEAAKIQDAKESDRLAKQLQKGQFTLQDFRTQLAQIVRPGLLARFGRYLPGGNAIKEIGSSENIAQVKKMIGMIDSMTVTERRKPKVIDNSRRRRIAEGSGSKAKGVKDLVCQFQEMKGMITGLSNKGSNEQIQAIQDMGAGLTREKTHDSSEKKNRPKRLTSAQKKKARKNREKKRRRRR